MRAILSCRYTVDGFPTGHHFMELSEDPNNVIQHPEDPNKTMHVHDFVKRLRDDAKFREYAGFHVVSELPGVPQGWTKWNALVEECNGPRGNDITKGFRLKHE